MRSLERRISSRVCSNSSLVSAAMTATCSTVSAIWPEVLASSSMVAEVSIAIELCSVVLAASWFDAVESWVAESERSVLTPCARVMSPPRFPTMLLKACPRVAVSTAPDGVTRTLRSPLEIRSAARESATIGRFSTRARMTTNTINTVVPAATRTIATVRRVSVPADALPEVSMSTVSIAPVPIQMTRIPTRRRASHRRRSRSNITPRLLSLFTASRH